MTPPRHVPARRGALVLAAVMILSACGSQAGRAPKAPPPPTAAIAPPASVGPGEGHLNLIALEGYLNGSWVKPFTEQSGCVIHARYVASGDDIVSLMQDGGGGRWDMVSAPGDVGLGLIYSGDVKPMNAGLIPDWHNFQPYFKDPAFNTVDGIHYGISLQWGPNSLLYNTKKFPNPPTSWNVIYDPANKGLITVPDNPMQIADAALYLSQSQPKLGIKDPYELTQAQFDAAVSLLKQERQLVKQYWVLPADEINLFQGGDVLIGPAWPYQAVELKAGGAPVADTIPQEGATAWGDTWMLATKATHPNCAYLWTRYVSTPRVQAEQALVIGETPVNSRACAEMESLQPGSCAGYHANATAEYLAKIKFWKTPMAQCPDGSTECIPYAQWQTAWSTIKG